VVWDENRLRRYPADDKDKIRRRHHQHFAAAGFDADRIINDDSTEVARYTIWAWRQLELSMEAPERMRVLKRPDRSTTSYSERDGELVHDVGQPVDQTPIDMRENGHAPLVPVLPAPVGQTVLPVFDYRPVTSVVPNPDGPGSMEVTSNVTVIGNTPLRQCSSCSLAAVCPLFEPESDCKYSIPIEIRNRDQLMGILNSLLEMQSQRVAFTFFGEQLQGGYPDANLSAELDRFMNMTAKVKDIADNRDFLKVTVEGRTQAGVLARLFGAERAETLRRVDPDRAEDAVRRTMT
jgi:hypothetical protein